MMNEAEIIKLKAELKKARRALKIKTVRLKKAKDDIEMLQRENRFLRTGELKPFNE